MKKTYLSIFVLFLISCFSPSCIEEYKMPTYATNDFEPELVIQGYILSGEESLVYLSMTQPVYHEGIPIPIPNAKVNIIGQNGYESKPAEFHQDRNCYIIDTERLSPETLYALRVELEGEVYQSDFSTIIDSPEIDEVTYKEYEDGVSIHLTTHADREDSRYYMWGYEEDWEFHAEVNLLNPQNGFFIYDKDRYTFDDSGKNPYYYCWKHQNSSNIFIYTTNKLQENTVKDMELVRIPADDIRISYIYSILVKQWSLTPEAYTYYQTLENMTENSGSLFQVMPSELRGNVACISNSDIGVRGYITFANVKTKRIFIYASEFETLVPIHEKCSQQLPPYPAYSGWEQSWIEQIGTKGAVIFSYGGNIESSSILYSRDCVDCRAVEGATKKRPDFWPNDHE